MLHTNSILHRTIVGLAVAGLLVAGCTRSEDDPTVEGAGGVTTTEAQSGNGGRLAEGSFGDLTEVCGEGDGAASGTGVDGDTISIGVVTDKGAELRPGLNQEMYDAGVAFAEWCNGLGGINGLKVDVVDLDAALFDYPAKMTEACETTFALVGGGAALDNAGHDIRIGCGLPNFSGYVVSPEARTADLQAFAVPGPEDKAMVGPFNILHETDPDVFAKAGSFSTDLPSVKITVDQDMEAVLEMGGTSVYEGTYAAAGGESNWRPFVQAMKSADVQLLTYAGEPTAMISLDKAFDAEGWYPKYIVMQANMADDRYVDEGGDTIGNVVIRTSFFPLFMAEENDATADYVELIDTYVDGGKKAMLGEQAISSWLLFARSVKECGSEVTRECALEKANEVTEWTGGGLHGRTNPSANEPTECFVTVKVEDGEFVYDEELTNPNEGIYNCSPDNVFTTTVQNN